MPLRNRLQPLIAGLATLALGGLIVWITSGYPLGSAARMGPGFLPMACGILIMLFGLGIILFDREGFEEMEDLSLLRPILAIFGGLIAWTFIAGRFGFVPATFALVLVSALAQPGARLWTTLLTAALLSGFGVIVFLMSLNIRLSAFRF